MNNSKFRHILLTREQHRELERMQEKYRSESDIGHAPSVHQIARSIFDRALQEQRT